VNVRLPWPFGRSTATDDATANDATPSAATPVAPAVSPEPRPTGAWATLPPIQRAVGAAPLVAASDTFLEAVPGVHPLSPIVQPLGHDVSPVAPAGLVVAPVHAVSSLTSHQALVPPPVQRRTEVVGGHAAPDGNAPATGAGPAIPPAAATTVTPSESVRVDPPARQLGIVTPAATAQPPDRPLTRFEPPAARPAGTERPLLGRRTQVQASPAASPTVAPAGPVASGARHSSQTDAAPARPGPASNSSPSTRRPGLGLPLPAAPATAVPTDARPRPGLGLQRMTAIETPTAGTAGPSASAAGGSRPIGSSPTAGAAPLRTTIQRRMTGLRTAGSEGEPATDRPGGGADLAGPSDSPTAGAASRSRASLPVLPVLRPNPRSGAADGSSEPPVETLPAPGTSPTATTPRPGASATSSAPAARTAGHGASGSKALQLSPTGPQRRPLAGSRPIGQIGAVQRSATGAPAPSNPVAGSPVGGGNPAQAWAGPAALGGAPFDAPSAPRWVLPGWEDGSSAADDAVVQRQSASGPVMPIAAGAGRGSGPGFARERAGGHGGSTAMPLAGPSGSAATSAFGQSGPSIGTLGTVARSIAPEFAGPSVQTVAAVPPVQGPVFGPTATPVVQRIDGSPPAASDTKGGAEHSDEELDELARSLFGRLRNRLRSEYIYEREAKGLTFDHS
jgi:hypothetical protein